MKIPYSYKPSGTYQIISETAEKLPNWCKFLKASKRGYQKYNALDWKGISQKLILKPFTIETFELQTDSEICFTIEIKEKITMLYFLLEGNVSFQTNTGCFLSEVNNSFFYLVQNNRGIYVGKFSAGFHIAVIITIAHNWLSKVHSDYPNLTSEIDSFLNNKTYRTFFPTLRLSKSIRRQLFLLISENETNISVTKKFFQYCIAKILSQYDKSVKYKKEIAAYKIKNYLDQHFTDPEIDTIHLVKLFHITDRTLRHQFRKLFHTSVKQYCNSLRMEYANQLLHNSGKKIKDVYSLVGFRDERSFRSAYNHFLRSSQIHL